MATRRLCALLSGALLLTACVSTTADTTTTTEPAPPTTRSVAATAPPPPSTTSTSHQTTTTVGPTTFLVWASGGLEPDLAASLAERFETTSMVKGGTVELGTPDGSLIPLEALAVDRRAHRPFDSHGFLPDVRPGAVVLGTGSASLREASTGDVLTLDGTEYEVSAVVPDEAVAYAEVVFDQADEAATIDRDRFVLIQSDLSPDELKAAVTEIEPETPLRILAQGDTPWFRHANGVLPQVVIKQALGEFSYGNVSGAMFDQDEDFRDQRIVTSDVPLLGETVCHGVVTEMLTRAMGRVIDEGLEGLVDPADYGGCWSPRFIRSGSGSPSGLSRHAWGAAVDINVAANPYGTPGAQDPRLVEIMEAEGFTWGGRWLVPDPMHFEYAVVPSEP